MEEREDQDDQYVNFSTQRLLALESEIILSLLDRMETLNAVSIELRRRMTLG